MFSLAASFFRGQFDGVSVIGLAAFVILLGTCGVFTREFWISELPIYGDNDAGRSQTPAGGAGSPTGDAPHVKSPSAGPR
jgi:hypothetical protein